jgi:hypothetical protein
LLSLEFIRRFLQHVLPTGFMKVRYYGFLSPGSKVPLEEVRTRIEMAFGFEIATPQVEPEPLPPMKCRHCDTPMIWLYSILPHREDWGTLLRNQVTCPSNLKSLARARVSPRATE